jgi:hypothetical protein
VQKFQSKFHPVDQFLHQIHYGQTFAFDCAKDQLAGSVVRMRSARHNMGTTLIPTSFCVDFPGCTGNRGSSGGPNAWEWHFCAIIWLVKNMQWSGEHRKGRERDLNWFLYCQVSWQLLRKKFSYAAHARLIKLVILFV